MAGDALFIGWGPVARGRELKGLEVFQETLAYYGNLQQTGRIESFEPVLIAPHGGDLAGFVLMRGSRTALDETRSSEEFRRRSVRAATVVDGLGIVDAYTGDALASQLDMFRTVSEEIG